MGNINWIASYPKSGNTWVRIFLTNLLYPEKEPAHINKLMKATIASSRKFLDEQLGIDTSLLTNNEIELMRPLAYQSYSDQTTTFCFHKTHDAFQRLSNHELLFQNNSTNKALYLIRNPLDVCISLAHHMNCSIDKAIHDMNDHKLYLASTKNKITGQVEQKLGTWSEHVQSWTSINEFEVLTIRYEDLIDFPQQSFSQISQFFNLRYTAAEIEIAINKCKFDILKNQEISDGFKEKSQDAGAFFRTGKKEQWQSELTFSQIDHIKQFHLNTMMKYNYA